MKQLISLVVILLMMLGSDREAEAQTCTGANARDVNAIVDAAKTDVTTALGASPWKIDAQTVALPASGTAAKAAFASLDADAETLMRLADTLTKRAEGEAGATQTNTRKAANQARTVAAILRTTAAKIAAAGPGSIEVKGGTANVVVRLDNPPNMRLRLSFATADGRSAELEWDPGIVSPLVRRVALPEGTWSVSPSVEPTMVQQGADTIVIATRWTELAAGSRPFTLVGSPTALVAASPVAGGARQIEMTGWPKPTLTVDCPSMASTLHTMDEERLGPAAAGGSAQRGMGVAPEIVSETLSILAEIAVERAKSGAMGLVKDRFVEPLCGKRDDTLGGVSLAVLHLGGRERAFPRTCELLHGLRLEDVLGSGDALLAALRDDLRKTIAPAVVVEMGAGRSFEPVLLAALDVANRAIDEGSFDGFAADLMLTVLGQVELLTGDLGRIAVDPAKLTSVDAVLEALVPTGSQAYTALCKSDGSETPAACASRVRTEGTTVDAWIRIVGTLVVTRADISALSQTLTPLLLGAIRAVAPGDLTVLATTYGHVATPSLDVLTPLTEALKVELEAAADETKVKLCGSKDLSADECARRLIQVNGALSDWKRTHDQLASRKDADLAALKKALEDAGTKLVKTHLEEARGYACGVRLAVAVIKRCSSQACSASDVADHLGHPEQFFQVDQRLPASLCWSGTVYAAPPARLAALQRHVLDGLALVQPVRDAKGRDRAVAALHLMFRVLAQHDPGNQVRLQLLEELTVALVEQRYDAALGTTLRLARDLTRDVNLVGRVPPGLDKLAALVGAVASYAKVYESTKDDDPTAAREARKKALESLIDAATDRRERGGKWIVSLGSNVGVGLTFSNQFNNETVGTGALGDDARELGVRVPLGVSLQRLPGKNWFGVHGSLQIADLGQFVTTGGDGAVDDVRWSSFVSPGLEVGILFGEPDRAVSLTVHGSYAPALSVTGREADGSYLTRDGAWRYGVSLGYYVPFFDLN